MRNTFVIGEEALFWEKQLSEDFVLRCHLSEA